ncbi:hypothetical protein ALC62_05738, partial [Cyphomyrmex costatus]
LTPNINMSKNKLKTSSSTVASTTATALQTKEVKDLTEELRAENIALKAEIQKLLKQIEEDKRKHNTSANIPTQNRFEILSETLSTQAQQNEDMDCQSSEDFATYLKRKNNHGPQDVNNNGNKKSRYSTKVDTNNHHGDSFPSTQGKSQHPTTIKTIRMSRPPLINILYQDPKDTTTLLKSKLKDLNSFYIKRINSGKHSLQVDTLENYKSVKDLLVKCNSKFYTYTSKIEKPIISY